MLELATKPRARREPRSVLCHAYQYNSLVDLTFEQSKNVAIAHFLVKVRAAIAYYWSAVQCLVRGVAYAVVGSRFI